MSSKNAAPNTIDIDLTLICKIELEYQAKGIVDLGLGLYIKLKTRTIYREGP